MWGTVQYPIKVYTVNECSQPSAAAAAFFQLPDRQQRNQEEPASADLFTLGGCPRQMRTAGSRYQVRRTAFGYSLSIVFAENTYARQMFHFAKSFLKKKNLHASIIFLMVMILIKSDEHFSLWINMYSNPVSQWSFKMYSPSS